VTEIDPRQLRSAFSSFMTGVTVVTTLDDEGNPIGFTANSFTSVSLEPPLLLVCPGRHLSSYGIYKQAKRFVVSILAEGQESVSNTFASSKSDRFSQVEWTRDHAGFPVISGACAVFSCETFQAEEAGDHLILIGRIDAIEVSGKRGLGYCSNGYFSLGKERQAEAIGHAGRKAIAGAVIEHNGKVMAVRTDNGIDVPKVVQNPGEGARTALQRHFSALGTSLSIGPVYSVYDNPVSGEHFTIFRGTLLEDVDDLPGDWVALDQMAAQTFATPALERMLKRFAEEYQNQLFGLYVGDTEHGEISYG
jgi:flavin reductase (DIM6/NTAB) family NADH-FMN oxidoreductase RutF